MNTNTKPYWRTKRCHIIMPERANMLAKGTLQDLTVYRDRYIDACAEAREIINYDFWDHDYYPAHSDRFPTLETDMRIALLERAQATLEKELEKKPDLWRRVLSNEIHFPEEHYIDISGRGGIGFRTEEGEPTNVKTDWIYVPYFGQCKFRRKYFDPVDLERVGYMRIRHYPDSGEWYLLLRIQVEYGYKESEPQDRELMPALAVSFGLDVLATCVESYHHDYTEYVNVALSDKAIITESRIAELEAKRKRQIIGTACQMGYDAWDKSFQLRDMTPRDRYKLENGPNYMKTTRVIGRLKKQLANHKYHERHQISMAISRGDFKFVVLDTTNFNVQSERYRGTRFDDGYLHEKLERTGFDLLSDEIVSSCRDHGVPIYRASSEWRGWNRCHKCNKPKAFGQPELSGEVVCRFCGHRTMPHVNNAENLLNYGESAYLEKHFR